MDRAMHINVGAQRNEQLHTYHMLIIHICMWAYIHYICTLAKMRMIIRIYTHAYMIIGVSLVGM